MLIKCNAADHLYLIEDDPVRAKLFKDNSVRFEDPFHVYAEVNDETGEIAAVVCVIICKFVPQDEYQLKLIAAWVKSRRSKKS
jgi:predicted RNA methylase